MRELKELLNNQKNLKHQIINTRNKQNKYHLVKQYTKISKKIIELDIEVLLYAAK